MKPFGGLQLVDLLYFILFSSIALCEFFRPTSECFLFLAKVAGSQSNRNKKNKKCKFIVSQNS